MASGTEQDERAGAPEAPVMPSSDSYGMKAVCASCGKVIASGDPRLAYPPPQGPLHVECVGGPSNRHNSGRSERES